MAIEIAYEDRFGENHPNAYHRINRRTIDTPAFGVLGNAPVKAVTIEVETWVRKQAKNNNKPPIVKRAFVMAGADTDAGVSMSDCYTYLLTIPEFWGGLSV